MSHKIVAMKKKIYQPKIKVREGSVPLTKRGRKSYIDALIKNAEEKVVNFKVGDLQYAEITECSCTAHNKLRKHFEKRFLVQYSPDTHICYISKGVS